MSAPPRLAYVAWVAICVIWGTTYLAIRVGLGAFPPGLLGAFRWLVAGALLAIVTRLRGEGLPPPSRWRDPAIQGVLLLGFGNGCVNWAEQYVPSGLAAVIIATVPFFMTGVEALFADGERITGSALAGLGVGFAGILILVWPDLHVVDSTGTRFIAGIVALQIACLGWAVGSSYSKRHKHPNESVLGITAMQMLCGGVALLAIGLASGEWPLVHPTVTGVSALVYLTVAGSLVGFVSYIYALQHLPVTLVSLYAYINPLIAVVLGAVLLGEPFSLRTVIAMSVVFLGIGLVRLGPAPAGRLRPTSATR